METDCVDLAWQAGVNFFFSYGMGQSPLLTDLRSLLSQHRESVIIATGSEQREVSHWVDYVEQVQWTLDLDTIDILFVEYVSPADNWELVTGLLDQLYAWKAEGLIRYVGITTHTRSIALRVVEEALCDVLMHRYNMAHRNAEEAVFPAVAATGLPVVAFTSTRWGTLLQGHSEWSGALPTAADCYRFGLYQPAIRLTLTAPKTRNDLKANLSVLTSPPMSAEEVAHWQTYGDLIYGAGKDAFETSWP